MLASSFYWFIDSVRLQNNQLSIKTFPRAYAAAQGNASCLYLPNTVLAACKCFHPYMIWFVRPSMQQSAPAICVQRYRGRPALYYTCCGINNLSLRTNVYMHTESARSRAVGRQKGFNDIFTRNIDDDAAGSTTRRRRPTTLIGAHGVLCDSFFVPIPTHMYPIQEVFQHFWCSDGSVVWKRCERVEADDDDDDAAISHIHHEGSSNIRLTYTQTICEFWLHATVKYGKKCVCIGIIVSMCTCLEWKCIALHIMQSHAYIYDALLCFIYIRT